jgi:hypothetical protein
MEETTLKYYSDRYRPAYKAVRLLVGLGTATKVVGWMLGLGCIAAGMIVMMLANSRNAPSAMTLVTTAVGAILVIFACHLLGSIIAAFGFLLRATTDSALHGARALTPDDAQRALAQSDP